MNINELSKLVGKATQALHANEKFAVPVLAVKASKAAQENPHDAPLVTASNILKKMATGDKLFISRNELNKLYDNLYTPNTKLAEVFAEELDRPALPGPQIFQRDPNESKSLDEDYAKVTDPVLANALSSVFEADGVFKPYSNEIATLAEKACIHELNALGVPPRKVSVFAGENEFIICNATYETPKGQSHVLVPVEITAGKACLPSMFLTTVGFVDLSQEALETHIVATAGKSYHVDGTELLKVLSVAKHGMPKVASDVELAMIRMRAASGTPASYASDNIVYQNVDEPTPDVTLPEVQLDPEHQSFAERLASPRGEAEYIFGANTVKAASDMISREVRAMGYKKAQVSVSASDDDTIFYAVSVNQNSAFKVPVKVANGRVSPPTIVIASGNIGEFSVAGIAKVLSEVPTDGRMLAAASPNYGLKPSELLDKVKKATAEGQYTIAEDAINVLAEIDIPTYKIAVSWFMNSLDSSKAMDKTAAEKNHAGCSRMVKNSANSQPICSHLNLPLHKVYQDENGDCQPLYRKAMQDVGSGAYFMAHKVLL